MSDDEKTILPQSSQQSSASANTVYGVQNSVPAQVAPVPARIVLPGEDAATPTTYSDHTMPLNIGSMSPNVQGSAASSAVAAPKSEPLGASILYPAIPASYPNNAQLSPSSPSRRNGLFPLSRNNSLIALPIGIAVIAIVLALLVIPVSAFWSSKNDAKTASTSKGVTTQPTPAAPVTPVAPVAPAVMPTAVPTTANSVADGDVSLTPDHLDIQNDCQRDNDYRCTVTLALASDAGNTVSWVASINGVDHDFDVRSGRLKPGEQQQIVFYLHDTCPIDAELSIRMRHQRLNIPLHCN